MRSIKGFTLIEVMITVAIVAILAAIALPSYQRYVVRTGRTEARALLVEIAARQERFRYGNPGYATTLQGLGFPAGALESENRRYEITMAADLTTFTLTAERRNSQVVDALCGDLTLTNTGVRGRTGTDTIPNCWR
jgi:type IV pilus assembly protein PilE